MLKEYRNKRNFQKTLEPKGEGKDNFRQSKKLKFVVQFHRARRDHYDFRLEWKGVLLSWAVPKGPSYSPKDKRLAVQVEDHPIEYANFEGNIPKGEYGGGTVMIWDEGLYEPQNDFNEGLKNGALKFVLHGKRLKGAWTLVFMKDKNWLLIKENDEYVSNASNIKNFKTSIRTGRLLSEISAEKLAHKATNPFHKVDVQLATLVEDFPKDKWLYEIKYDGYRMVAFVEDDRARLVTRNGKDYTDKFKNIEADLIKLAQGRPMVLDGEVIVTDEEGKPNFQNLQQHLKNPKFQPVYMVFDLLALDGEDLRQTKLLERKRQLKKLLKNPPSSINFSAHIVGKGQTFFEEVEKMGLEGVVGKNPNSMYVGKRNGDWIKIKSYKRAEFVVGGYVKSDKKSSQIAALLLGVYQGGKLKYVGKTGTGFDAKEGAKLLKALKKTSRSRSPFADSPKIINAVWVTPNLIAEVQFAEFTDSGTLRQASFKVLRDDKNPEDVVELPLKTAKNKNGITKAENSASKNSVFDIEITNPDRVVFPKDKLTKMDIAQYYQKVAKRMFKYVDGRVLSVVRAHENIKHTFYKKHPLCDGDGVKVIEIKNDKNQKSPYFYINDEKGIIKEVQLGSIEFHIWGSEAQNLEKPNYMVFDLDPDKGLGLEKLRQGVEDVRKTLSKLRLKSFLKTSGGKGYHIVVPFEPCGNWEKFYEFAHRVAMLLEKEHPDRYTTNIRKINRRRKIFIDYMRNNRGSTSVAPYSLRARQGAKVSMPISWTELYTIAPSDIGINEAVARLSKPDPWKNFFKVKQIIK